MDGNDAMMAIIITIAWKYLGYNFIFFLSALQSVPRALIDPARATELMVYKIYFDGFRGLDYSGGERSHDITG